MSDDFTWQPEPSARCKVGRIRVGTVLACAAIGIAASTYYPITSVIRAFERAALTRVSSKGNVPSKAVQQDAQSTFPTAHNALASSKAEPKEEASQAGRPVVLLNPGSGNELPAPSDDQRATPSSTKRGIMDRQVPPRSRPTRSSDTGSRTVLVVVRRREPPYDTKVLRGRIHSGQLIVNARGITLR